MSKASQHASFEGRGAGCRHGRTHHAESGHAGKVGRSRVAVTSQVDSQALVRQPNHERRQSDGGKTRRRNSFDPPTTPIRPACPLCRSGDRGGISLLQRARLYAWRSARNPVTTKRRERQNDSRLCMVGGGSSSTHSASKDSSSRQGCESSRKKRAVCERASEKRGEQAGDVNGLGGRGGAPLFQLLSLPLSL